MSNQSGSLFRVDELDTDYDGKMSAKKENDAARERMATKRAAGRDIEIPEVIDPERRAACEFNLERFCLTYFKPLFYLALCVIHKEIIANLQETILRGGRVAIASPRGFGKTTLTLIAIIWAVVYGHAKYIVLVSATKEEAGERLEKIKAFFEEEESLLLDDFPEACVPVIALEGASQKSRLQTFDGVRTRLRWGEKRIMFARLENSPSSGTIMTVRGLDSAIRGLVYGELRPDLVMVDDPQTDESAKSSIQTESREHILTNGIEGLVGPGKALAIISLWTVIVKNDLADRYTSDLKPSYLSMRYKSLDPLPVRRDLVDEYILMRQDAMKKGDRKARSAHAWYLRHQVIIEGKGLAAWMENFVANDVGDSAMKAAVKTDDLAWAEAQFGTEENSKLRQEEISAIQHCLNFIADTDWDTFNSELQNDPPEGENANIVILDEMQIREKTSGYARGIVPDDAVAVVLGGDVGRYALHWVAQAVRPRRRIAVIDYDSPGVNSPGGKVDLTTNQGKGIQKQIKVAVIEALRSMRDHLTENPYCKADGTPVPIIMAMVDSRYAQAGVRAWADESGVAWQAIVGMGTKRGLANWHIPRSVKPRDIAPDGNLYAKQDNDGFWRYHANTDAYKRDIHAGILLDPDAAGSICIFDPEDRMTHKIFAQHLVAEREEEMPGGGSRWVDVKGRRANHYFDGIYNGQAAISYVEFFLPEVSLEWEGVPTDETDSETEVTKRRTGPRQAKYIDSQGSSGIPARRRKRRQATYQ